ncbi:MAG: PAS domain-containing protein, partial [Sphingomicrobium sp.]
MRRSRFAGAVKTNVREQRAGWLDTLSFDLRPPVTSDDSAITEQRVSQLTFVPLLLGVAHLISSIAILLHYGFAIPARVAPLLFGPMILAMLFDLAALAFMQMRERLEVSPRTVTLVMSLVVLVSSGLWTLFGYAASLLPNTDQSGILPIVIGTVVVASAVAVSSSPPLAVVCAFVGTLGAAIVSGDPAVVAGIGTMSMVVVGYSVASARIMIATAHDRLLLDHEAHKALHFVNEFENSGRGWFWETNSQGTLSYVSQQLADDFQTDPETLLGRQFTTLLSVDASPEGGIGEERTLGFHLSARFPFSEVIVRAATNDDVHWSLSGNPVFDENGR